MRTPLNKSRNEKKREAKRAVKWGMDLAQFPPPQIKLILKAAALEQEVFEALMLAKVLSEMNWTRYKLHGRIGDLQKW
ncbi:uncharacterized protein LOC116255701 isoform X2 [Nymphaea colorata]|uniref:uncharacterized protein LOC116255701 isoform X2 n=1 Tax=Nymphaea colorata TaxID=210225 RepID=UPI00129E038B|nr:uncharacterized protein LOC116255701 isoform X2 [Nymphaea colorata]